jgi:hypothetical protein
MVIHPDADHAQRCLTSVIYQGLGTFKVLSLLVTFSFNVLAAGFNCHLCILDPPQFAEINFVFLVSLPTTLISSSFSWFRESATFFKFVCSFVFLHTSLFLSPSVLSVSISKLHYASFSTFLCLYFQVFHCLQRCLSFL